jgi:hypothetical protein
MTNPDTVSRIRTLLPHDVRSAVYAATDDAARAALDKLERAPAQDEKAFLAAVEAAIAALTEIRDAVNKQWDVKAI